MPGSLGSTISCTFSIYWDGSAFGFAGEVADGIAIVSADWISSLPAKFAVVRASFTLRVR
jgi:hypothetical protein